MLLELQRIIKKLLYKQLTNAHTNQSNNTILYFKKIALCAPKDTSWIINLNQVASYCDQIEYDIKQEIYISKGQQYTLEQLKSLYEYVWFLPENFLIDVEMIRNVILKLCKQKLDFILLSFSLEDAPFVATLPEAYANVIVSTERVCGWRKLNFLNAYGRLQRLFYSSDNKFELFKIESFFAEKLHCDHKLYYNQKEIIFDEGKYCQRQTEKYVLPYLKSTQRPTILVLPVFLMVGGVERNTVGVMEQLKDRYDFVTVVFEGLIKKNGSMHGQVRGTGSSVLDFAEALEYDQYLDALRDVRDIYQPDAVWVCNGSNWFCDNAQAIRKIFMHTPIIDQEVYDTEAGWIGRYMEPGIQSFDRFIAINTKIYHKFTHTFNMDPKKVDIIYSVVNLNITKNEQQYFPEEMRQKYNIPNNKPVIAFIGRLTSQKRPDLLIKLIGEINSTYSGYHFMIIGNGELKGTVEKLIADLKIANVTMVDYIKDLSEVYIFIDGILFVSAFEGLPIVVLEGLVKEIPILCTDVGDVRLVLEKYQAGLIFRGGIHKDLQLMKEDFFQFMKERDTYALSIRKNKDAIINQFSTETIAEEWSASFEQAIKQKSGDYADESKN